MMGNRTRRITPMGMIAMALWSLLVTTSLSLAATRQDDQARARQGIARVDSLLQTGEAEAAIAVCNSLLISMANDPIYGWQIEGRLGVALLIGDHPAEAIPYLEAQAMRQPHEAIHHRNLGAALVMLNRRGRALSEYRVAVELAPGDADLRREYGQMLLTFGDTRGAGRELEMASRLCGGCPEMDEPLATLYLQAKQYPQAVQILSKIYAEDAGPENRRRLVVAMSHAENDSALVLFLRESKSSNLTAEEWRLLVEAEGRWAGDKTASQQVAVALNPEHLAPLPAAIKDDHRFWGHVALNLMAGGENAEGLWAVDHALSLAPDELVYLNNRVVLLTNLGRDDEAKQTWQRVIAIDPSLAIPEANESHSNKGN